MQDCDAYTPARDDGFPDLLGLGGDAEFLFSEGENDDRWDNQLGKVAHEVLHNRALC